MKRLHVNLNDPSVEALHAMTARKDLNVTEVIRQAVGTYKFFEDARERGARVQILEPDGRVVEVLG